MYSEAPVDKKDVMVVKSVRCAGVAVVAVSDTVPGSVAVLVGSAETTVLVESCSLIKLEVVIVVVGSVEATVLVIKLAGVVVVVESGNETVLVESCSLAELEDAGVLE